ncbi:MAG: hypothetical protein A2534_01085 [Candidatus Magasanikbacteria bacterium RIFOXYD2_FULL_39_9]|uniref:Uncharacterized protein n=1 Tax=Candidatus Magasanikbacteria bacterium RIFOXYD1_FULL_40_23 TaxID=1798705 RepID=A0A1F6PB48_9BACT|nr:MAG: hypothetical protein A2534_01085 [Candidatus Magasanikbacteria bacterium RIFOXYD2_FULL_39_9]OGH93270.1 MAG: hypothetical protein A2563_01545 [Candidatus Magasanikbacteria bacterium RIFOXYD1_FULL_40_23]
MIKKSVLILAVVLPWVLILIFGLFGLETRSHFFQENEVRIKISLLVIVLLACIFSGINLFKEKQKNYLKILKAAVFLGIFIITFLSMWFILALRNGVRF